MIHFEIPKNQASILKVIGVGGGGSNAVNYMYSLGIEGVDFIICNTDSQALNNSEVPNKIQLGPLLTSGLGAGANPEIGKQASEESMEEINKLLSVNTRMAFVTAGMGGGTGTGGAPVVAKICRDLGILTVGIVTTPFTYEGRKRMKQAQEGIEKLRDHVDTILIISNDKLRQQFGNLPFTQAFAKADDVLATAAKCITDVITTSGQVNVDFADVTTVMKSGGVAILGKAVANGENRACKAVEEALNSPLLNDSDISGAKWILLNVNSAAGEFEHTLDELDAIQAYVQQQAGDNCELILGVGHDNNLEDKIAVTVIATGFNHQDINLEAKKKEAEKIVVSLNKNLPIAEKQVNVSSFIEPTNEPVVANYLEPQMIEMPSSFSLHFSEIPLTTPDFSEEKTHFDLFELPLDSTPEVPITFESTNFEIEESTPQNIKLTFKADENSEIQPNPMLNSPLTNLEAETEKRNAEQRKALEERAERLRKMSFNFKSGEQADDLENIPAFVRQNRALEDGVNSNETVFSNYSIGYNEEQKNENQLGGIQTINTFLDGTKPD